MGIYTRSPDFTELFLTISLARPRFLFTFEEDGKLIFFSSPQTQDPDKNSSLLVVDVAYIPADVSSQICGHVNGLICRQNLKRSAIHNLTTRESVSVTLPEVRKDRSQSRNYFGYDPIVKQFKILSMAWSLCGVYDMLPELRVLTFGEHLWRKVECCIPHHPLYDGICINGVLYYAAREIYFSVVSMIVCFDVRSEKLSYINVDQGMVIKRDSILINYKGKLGLLHDDQYDESSFGVGRNTKNVFLWILEDVEKHKWLKHIYKSPSSYFKLDDPVLYFVGLVGTSEIVMSPYFIFDPFYVFYYNLEKNTIRRVKIRGLEALKTLPKVHTFIDYVENVTPM